MTVAVSALSGCVTVQRPLAPGPATAPSQREPRPAGKDGTQVVQAPAREALEMVGPSRPARPPASPPGGAAPTARPPERSTPPDGRNGRSRPEPGGRATPRRPPAALPGVAGPVRPDASGSPDLCALGRQYGGWRADSPEAAICRETYGR
ncbi:hypothetical protein ACF1AE_24870 [Streptomyces sp. NPDC014986]|uniref:hypothetical protein n=1 Tax=Streptomyces sp. NPDC014986 TaxID=3364934 RepID=UPI0036FFA722